MAKENFLQELTSEFPPNCRSVLQAALPIHQEQIKVLVEALETVLKGLIDDEEEWLNDSFRYEILIVFLRLQTARKPDKRVEELLNKVLQQSPNNILAVILQAEVDLRLKGTTAANERVRDLRKLKQEDPLQYELASYIAIGTLSFQLMRSGVKCLSDAIRLKCTIPVIDKIAKLCDDHPDKIDQALELHYNTLKGERSYCDHTSRDIADILAGVMNSVDVSIPNEHLLLWTLDLSETCCRLLTKSNFTTEGVDGEEFSPCKLLNMVKSCVVFILTVPGSEKMVARCWLTLSSSYSKYQCHEADGNKNRFDTNGMAELAYKLCPNDVYVMERYGLHLRMRGRYEEAIRVLKNLLAKIPTRTLAWHQLGQCYMSMRDMTISKSKANQPPMQQHHGNLRGNRYPRRYNAGRGRYTTTSYYDTNHDRTYRGRPRAVPFERGFRRGQNRRGSQGERYLFPRYKIHTTKRPYQPGLSLSNETYARTPDYKKTIGYFRLIRCTRYRLHDDEDRNLLEQALESFKKASEVCDNSFVSLLKDVAVTQSILRESVNAKESFENSECFLHPSEGRAHVYNNKEMQSVYEEWAWFDLMEFCEKSGVNLPMDPRERMAVMCRTIVDIEGDGELLSVKEKLRQAFQASYKGLFHSSGYYFLREILKNETDKFKTEGNIERAATVEEELGIMEELVGNDAQAKLHYSKSLAPLADQQHLSTDLRERLLRFINALYKTKEVNQALHMVQLLLIHYRNHEPEPHNDTEFLSRCIQITLQCLKYLETNESQSYSTLEGSLRNTRKRSDACGILLDALVDHPEATIDSPLGDEEMGVGNQVVLLSCTSKTSAFEMCHETLKQFGLNVLMANYNEHEEPDDFPLGCDILDTFSNVLSNTSLVLVFPDEMRFGESQTTGAAMITKSLFTPGTTCTAKKLCITRNMMDVPPFLQALPMIEISERVDKWTFMTNLFEAFL